MGAADGFWNRMLYFINKINSHRVLNFTARPAGAKVSAGSSHVRRKVCIIIPK